ncbi:MAG: hypothetical protein JWO69_1510, partial [Thermoleophilia bacterium]|nr:hypothetical protein [Thermoleophilia bacterium]
MYYSDTLLGGGAHLELADPAAVVDAH